MAAIDRKVLQLTLTVPDDRLAQKLSNFLMVFR